jgi:hypothetical protein
VPLSDACYFRLSLRRGSSLATHSPNMNPDRPAPVYSTPVSLGTPKERAQKILAVVGGFETSDDLPLAQGFFVGDSR